MDFKLNFLGVTAADFEAAFHFYTNVLGIESKHFRPDWAYLETTGMTCELFLGEVLPDLERSWGRGQAIRPSFQVIDLHRMVSSLRQQGVIFTGNVEKTLWGERIEFAAPGGIRWTLAHAPGYPSSQNLQNPHLGWVEMKVHDLPAQKGFYTDVLGLHSEKGKNSRVIFRQEEDEPLLFLEPGGQPPPAIQTPHQVPFFVSFETDHIQKAAAWVKSCEVTILQDVTLQDWGGTDLILTDADGNPIQVVQYA